MLIAIQIIKNSALVNRTYFIRDEEEGVAHYLSSGQPAVVGKELSCGIRLSEA